MAMTRTGRVLRCTRCGWYKARSQFGLRTSWRPHSWCKECHNAHSREYKRRRVHSASPSGPQKPDGERHVTPVSRATRPACALGPAAISPELAGSREQINLPCGRGRNDAAETPREAVVTVEIPLFGRHGGLALVDECDWPRVQRHKWYSSRDGNGRFYARAQIDGASAWMHRFILGTPRGVLVDHIDFDGLNNTRANLRHCTINENNRHVRTKGCMGLPYRGITRTAQFAGGEHWRATIRVNGERIRSRHFPTPLQAAQEYDRLARVHHGAFAVLNFPESPAGATDR